jgi:endonuclease/exonuclease/phosphatase family metal-dependent hydrolase
MKLVFIFFCVFVFYVSQVFAQIKSNFSILSYNIKGLPPIAAPGWKNERFAIIAQRLADRVADGTAPDIVVLQEVFTKESQSVLARSGYPYISQGPTRNGNGPGGSFQKLFSGGVYILSLHPILESGLAHFAQGECATWDCHANKGLHYIKIQLPGINNTITVFNTHLQAGKDHDAIRLSQLKVVESFVNQNTRANEILIFGGDFNSSPLLSSFNVIKTILRASTVGEYCTSPLSDCQILNNTPIEDLLNSAVDHIFYRTSNTSSVIPMYTMRNFTEIFDDKTLSDHLGFEAGFHIQNLK